MKLTMAVAARLALGASAVLLAPPAQAQLGDVPEAGDRLGTALVSGDWNGDGIADLAIGVPLETVNIVKLPPLGGTYKHAGLVHVVYGASGGLDPDSDRLLGQGPGTATLLPIGVGNRYGSALVCGDFDHDGFDDLAIGIPGQTVNGFAGAGAVQILLGSPLGLSLKAGVYVTQDTAGIADRAEAGDGFGASLSVGNFGGDVCDDLAIGVPMETVGSVAQAGAAHVIHGGRGGFTSVGNTFWTQTVSLQEQAETRDLFASALAAGDFDLDGFDDLAVGVPGEGLDHAEAGVVHVIRGSAAGMTAAGNQLWHQDVLDLEGAVEAGDHFGSALLAADLDFDGISDLAVGIPQEATLGIRSGGVQVLFGSLGGLAAQDDFLITQENPFLFEELEDGDRFGASLTAWDRGNGIVHMLIGVPGESIGAVPGAGVVEAVGIGRFRFVTYTLLLWTILASQSGDAFGTALATGDFSGDGSDDLAVSAPSTNLVAIDTGLVLLVYASDPIQEFWMQGD